MASKRFIIEYELDVLRKKKNKDNYLPEPMETPEISPYLQSYPDSEIRSVRPKRLNLSPLLNRSSSRKSMRATSPTAGYKKSTVPTTEETVRRILSHTSEHIANVINRLSSESSRPGSPPNFAPYSSHIERKLLSGENLKQKDEKDSSFSISRPLTSSHHKQESFYRASTALNSDIERFKRNIHKPLLLKGWDDRFVFEGSLTRPVRAHTASIHKQHQKFVTKMAQFRHSPHKTEINNNNNNNSISNNNNNNNNNTSSESIISTTNTLSIPIIIHSRPNSPPIGKLLTSSSFPSSASISSAKSISMMSPALPFPSSPSLLPLIPAVSLSQSQLSTITITTETTNTIDNNNNNNNNNNQPTQPFSPSQKIAKNTKEKNQYGK
jgi:hypothetical protein